MWTDEVTNRRNLVGLLAAEGGARDQWGSSEGLGGTCGKEGGVWTQSEWATVRRPQKAGSKLTVLWELSGCHGDVAATTTSQRFAWERQGWGRAEWRMNESVIERGDVNWCEPVHPLRGQSWCRASGSRRGNDSGKEAPLVSGGQVPVHFLPD